MKRSTLFGMIDKKRELYCLYDKNNDLIYAYKNLDVLYSDDIVKMYIRLDRSNYRFYICKEMGGEVIRSTLIPIRTNLLWAVDDEAMRISPFCYLSSYDNSLEKYLVYAGISTKIVNYIFDNSDPREYLLKYDKDKRLKSIDIYTTNNKVYKKIVLDLRQRE